MVKRSVIAVLAGVVLASPASAQSEAELVKARQQIFMMEGIFEGAVKVGIDSFRQQLAAVMPDDMLLVAGDGPQARGFRLKDVGILFDVEVPAVRPSLAWSLRTMNETASLFLRDLAQMRDAIRRSVSDERTRAELERGLSRIQQQVVPTPDPAGPGDARTVTAAQPPAAPDPRSIDPGLAYTEAVQNALVDAMIDYGSTLTIAPAEWLIVAARDNSQGGGLVASDPSDVITVVLRIRGSDIAAFRAGTLTADEVRQRVEVGTF